MLRIVGGAHRGRRIAAPAGDFARPTAERVRESLFSILTSRGALDEARVLDACAGSGALGLEALSRGAAHATFFDTSRRALRIVEQNAESLSESARIDVRQTDATRPPPATAPCSLVFIDAPYASDTGERALPALAARGWLTADALIVVETAKRKDFKVPEGFAVEDSRDYGATRLMLLRYSG